MRALPRVVMAVLSTAVLAAGCASGTDPTNDATLAPSQPSTPVQTATPVSSTSPSALPAPISYGPAVLVTGWETCRISLGQLETTAEGMTMMREGAVVCQDETNDTRVSGTVLGTARGDFWGPHSSDTAGVTWGDLRLENDGGTWIGTYTGAYTSETGDMFLIWYEGTGDYEGLSYFQWVTPAPGEVTRGSEFVGLIFPGPPPPR